MTIYDLDTDRAVVAIPGVEVYRRASDGLSVTPILGRISSEGGEDSAEINEYLTDYSLSYTGRLDDVLEDLGALVTFDWVPEDLLAPRGSEGVILAATGAPEYDMPTPWQDQVGSPLLAGRMGAVVGLTGTKAALGAVNDVAVITLARQESAVGVNARFADCRGGGLGFQAITNNGSVAWVLYGDGATKTATVAAECTGWVLTGVLVDRVGGTITPWCGDVDGAPVAIGLLGSLGVVPATLELIDLGSASFALLRRLVIIEGAGLAATITAAWRQRLTESWLGLAPSYGARGAVHTRASQRSYYVGQRCHILGRNTPPAGGSGGYGPGDAISSVAYRNFGYVAGDTALVDADVGLVVTLETESGAGLTALKSLAPDAGRSVLQIANPTGGTLYARLTNAIGSTSRSWGSVRCRGTAGTLPALGWQTAAGAFTQILAAVLDSWARSKGVAAPAVATDKLALEIAAGATVRVVLPCGGVLTAPGPVGVVPDEVPSQASVGSSAAIVRDTLTTPIDPTDTGGCIELKSAPVGWSDFEGATDTVLTCGANVLMTLDGRIGEVQVTDGTLTPYGITDDADGVEATYRASWGSGRLGVGDQAQSAGMTDYDDALPAGALTIYSTGRRRITSLRVLRNFGALRQDSISSPPLGLALPSDLWVLTGESHKIVRKTLINATDPTLYTLLLTTALVVGGDDTIRTVSGAVAGDYPLTVAVQLGGVTVASGSCTVHVVDDLGVGDPTWDVLLAGDSITVSYDYPDRLIALGAGHLISIGSQATPGGTLCEGYAGQPLRWHATVAASPWLDTGRNIDIAAWRTVNGTPEAIVWLLCTNDLANIELPYIDALCPTLLAYYQRLIDAWEAAVPGVVQVIAILPPGSSSQALFDADYPPPGTVLATDFAAKRHRLVEWLLDRATVDVVDLSLSVDPDADYSGGAGAALHPNASGRAEIAARIYACLVDQLT